MSIAVVPPPPPDFVSEALSRLHEAIDGLQSLGWWQVPSPRLGGVVESIARAEARLASITVAVAGEAGGRGVPGEEGAKDGGAWLRRYAPFTPGQARARADLAEAFTQAELAPTRDALATGGLGIGHAGVITRTLSRLTDRPDPVDEVTRGEAQAWMIDWSSRLDPVQLGAAGRRMEFRLTPDAAERLAKDEDAQDRAREAYLFQERSGMWRLSGLLPPVAGAKLKAALDPLAAPRPADDGCPDPRTARQRTADAVQFLAERALSARPGDPGALPTRGGAPTRLMVVTDLDTLLARHGRPGLAPGELATGEPGGWDISPLTVQTMACDAEILPVLIDPGGRPLDVGRTRYPFPPKIRRAIELRDRHCTFPDCRVPPDQSDVHHMKPFSQGGQTSADNGTLVCGHDHRTAHAEGWIAELIDGRVRWRRPRTGETFYNDHIKQTERAIHDLALRWLARNPHLHNPTNQ